MSDTTPQEASSGQTADQTPTAGQVAPSGPRRSRGGGATAPPMRCAEARPYLSAYADGELAESLRPLVAAHIADCAECRALVQRAQSVDHLLASLPRTVPSPEVYERVQAAVARQGLDPVVREPLAPSRWAQEIGGVSARAVKRLLTPRVVYPQEPDLADDESRPAGAPTPFRQRRPWAVAALPAVAALLLISLSLALFNGLVRHQTPPQATIPTPIAQVGAGLKQAEIALQREESNVSFRPVMPAYLPPTAHLSTLTTDKLADTLLIIWAFATTSGVQQMTLRESPQVFVECQPSYAGTGGEWLQWGLSGFPTWMAMTCDGNASTPAVGQQRPTVDIALTATPRTSADTVAVVGQLRTTSLSMDVGQASYQAQVNLEQQLGQHPQSTSNLYLHFIATASAASGAQYTIKGETNTPFIPASGHREERITITTAGSSTTDIVNGASAVRFVNNDFANYQSLPYPAQGVLGVGRDGEPGADAVYYFTHLATTMESGEVWVVNARASLNNRPTIELAVVDAPVAITIYVDAKTYAILTIISSFGGQGGVGAPNRLAASAVVCPGTGARVADCSIRYSALWITSAPTSSNDFSLTPPVASVNGRALTFHLKPIDQIC